MKIWCWVENVILSVKWVSFKEKEASYSQFTVDTGSCVTLLEFEGALI